MLTSIAVQTNEEEQTKSVSTVTIPVSESVEFRNNCEVPIQSSPESSIGQLQLEIPSDENTRDLESSSPEDAGYIGKGIFYLVFRVFLP